MALGYIMASYAFIMQFKVNIKIYSGQSEIVFISVETYLAIRSLLQCIHRNNYTYSCLHFWRMCHDVDKDETSMG